MQPHIAAEHIKRVVIRGSLHLGLRRVRPKSEGDVKGVADVLSINAGGGIGKGREDKFVSRIDHVVAVGANVHAEILPHRRRQLAQKTVREGGKVEQIANGDRKGPKIVERARVGIEWNAFATV